MIRQATAFHTKRRLGQNFLVDTEALQQIAAALDIAPEDQVLEIGPGLGFLTQYLVGAGASVTAVELDQECVGALQLLSLPNLDISHGDFLRFDLASQKHNLKVVGNVPYQITTPILCYLFGEIGAPKPWFNQLERVVMTVQYEVAERFIAKPGTGEYSQISLLCNYFAESEILFKLDSECFYPKPRVTSAVVRFTPLSKPPIECTNHRLLRQVIKAGFGQRRKMLKNNLSFLKLSSKQLDKVFYDLQLDPQTRAERLSLAQFAKLTDEVDILVNYINGNSKK